MKRKKLLLGITAVMVYLLLLGLLILAESAAPEGNIRSLPAAIWYSLTTLTTVGYGDLYPVTAAGRLIGVLFQLMSVGLLALLIGAFVTLLRGRLLPLLRLRLSRKRDWFAFSDASPAAQTLAKALHREDPDRVILFCSEKPSPLPFALTSPVPPTELCGLKGEGSGLSVFCMGRRSAENEALARALEEEPCAVYCMTEYEPDRLPARQHRFDPYDCCARLYWRRFPLREPRQTVLLIGQGKYAEALLEQALQNNVLDPAQRIVYRVFGNYENFRRDHPFLSQLCAVNGAEPDRDSLYFSDAPWNGDLALLQTADRIIFCEDTEETTLARLTELRRFFPVTCPVHARLSTAFDGAACFGSPEEIFSPELVLRARLDRTAVRLNEIYRSSVGGDAPDWNGLNSFTRRSNIASAEHLSVKIRILLGEEPADPPPAELCARAYAAFRAADGEARDRFRRIEHERWMRFHLLNNWQYAPTRDNARRLHPMLVPFEQLSENERRKDDFAWELLDAISRD